MDHVWHGAVGAAVGSAVVSTVNQSEGWQGAIAIVALLIAVRYMHALARYIRLMYAERTGYVIRHVNGYIVTTNAIRHDIIHSWGADFAERFDSDSFMLVVSPITCQGTLINKHYAFRSAWQVDMREYRALVCAAHMGPGYLIPRAMAPPPDFEWASVEPRKMMLMHDPRVAALEPLYAEIAQWSKNYAVNLLLPYIRVEVILPIIEEYIDDLAMLHNSAESATSRHDT